MWFTSQKFHFPRKLAYTTESYQATLVDEIDNIVSSLKIIPIPYADWKPELSIRLCLCADTSSSSGLLKGITSARATGSEYLI